jgi:hypothetical protein
MRSGAAGVYQGLHSFCGTLPLDMHRLYALLCASRVEAVEGKLDYERHHDSAVAKQRILDTFIVE